MAVKFYLISSKIFDVTETCSVVSFFSGHSVCRRRTGASPAPRVSWVSQSKVSYFDADADFIASSMWRQRRDRLPLPSLQGVAPSYLADDLRRTADLEAQHRLRSASSPSLVVRRTRLSTYGDRAFPVAASISSLEQFATPRHVCTVTACFLQSSEDLSLQTQFSCYYSVVPAKWHLSLWTH